MAKRITLTEATATIPEKTTYVASESSPNSQPHRGGEDTFEAVVNFARYLITKRKSIFATVAVGLFLAGAWLLLTPNIYRSNATILPSGSQSSLADLKSLAGMPVTEENPTALYPVILSSQWMLDREVATPIAFSHEGEQRQITLQKYFGIENPDILRASLSGITTVNTDKRTGVISVSAETIYPGLSQAIVQRYIDNLEDFNMNHRASQARNNASYLERQVVERASSLHQAEDRLELFQNSNRAWMVSSDPELIKTIARMKLEIETQTQAYLYLRQQHEMAKFDAQKDTPIIRLLDRPSVPSVKSAPVRSLILILALFVSFGISVVYNLAGYALRRRREQTSSDSLGLLVQDVRSAVPWLGRRAATQAAQPVSET